MKSAIGRRIEYQITFMGGCLDAEVDRAEPAGVLDFVASVDVGIVFGIIVQDLVQGAKDEDHVRRGGRIDVGEGYLRCRTAQIIVVGCGRAELDKGLVVRVAGSVRCTEAKGARPAVVERDVSQQVDVARFRCRIALDRIVDSAEVGRTAVERRDSAGDRGAVDDSHVRQRATVAYCAVTPCQEILVDVVGRKLRVKPGQVELDLIARTELYGDVTAGADALLLEQGRTDQRRVKHFARTGAEIDCVITENLDTVTPNVALLPDNGAQNTEGLVIVLPAYQTGELRIAFFGKVRVNHFSGRVCFERIEIEWVARFDVYGTADTTFFNVRL